MAVVGGGLAGLAAAVRLVEQGASVELFEARCRLGGRAGSFRHPRTNQGVAGPKRSGGPESNQLTDYGQHVSMGCSTALAELLRRTGLADTFETHRRLNLIGPDGRHCTLAAARWLPAPLHLLPSLLRLNFLTLGERWRVARAMWAMKKGDSPIFAPAAPAQKSGQSPPGGWAIAQRWPSEASADEPAEDWLRRHGQSQQAVDRFWSPILISALSETLDRASLRVAAKVIVEGLLASRRGYELQIPRLPLAEIFDRRLGGWLESRGVQVRRLARVARIEGDRERARELVFRDGRHVEFDAVVVAVPWDRVDRLLSPELQAAVPELSRVEQIGPAAITTVHLGYDRPITDVPHAMLVGRLGQWVFQKPGNQYQVVISASHRLVKVSRQELSDQIERELAEVFPEAASAKVVHRRVIVQPRAVFAACPGIDQLRPPQETAIANLALAGDWTATGWPATMESAVRSGNVAAEVILRFL